MVFGLSLTYDVMMFVCLGCQCCHFERFWKIFERLQRDPKIFQNGNIDMGERLSWTRLNHLYFRFTLGGDDQFWMHSNLSGIVLICRLGFAIVGYIFGYGIYFFFTRLNRKSCPWYAVKWTIVSTPYFYIAHSWESSLDELGRRRQPRSWRQEPMMRYIWQVWINLPGFLFTAFWQHIILYHQFLFLFSILDFFCVIQGWI